MPLTLLRQTEYSIKLATAVKLGWSIVCIKGSQVIIPPPNMIFLSLKINFVLAYSADPDEMLHNAAFHLGFHCLPKYPYRVFSALQKVKAACQKGSAVAQW